MKTMTQTKDWLKHTQEMAKAFKERSAENDLEGSFVKENYDTLKEEEYFSAMIPEALGGGGISHHEMCNILRIIGQHDGSTALAMSMHQHLIAAAVWNYNQGNKEVEPLLRKVAEEQTVLVSTGATDWLESNGTVEKTEGGYLVSAMKHFASQSAIGDMMITSAPYQDPEKGWQVLHFGVPFDAEGLQILNNWNTLGMRATGSHTVKLENVFVPEEKISLSRPRGEFHPVWNVVLTVAMPLIMSAYIGIAQKASSMAIDQARNMKNPKPYLKSSVGEMNNALVTAELNWKDMIFICNNFDFEPIDLNGHEILTRKTNVALSVVRVVELAMEIVGGQGYFRKYGLEQLFRDIQASKYHPLQEKDQYLFSGNFILNQE